MTRWMLESVLSDWSGWLPGRGSEEDVGLLPLHWVRPVLLELLELNQAVELQGLFLVELLELNLVGKLQKALVGYWL